ncbi:MAG: hypothetical protein AB7P31_13775 [Steroidobacteraceae bacterium]
MPPYRITRGEIGYFHRERGITGREAFTISAATDGSRTVRACCEMDDGGLLRDVTYTVDGAWRPRHAFVQLMLGGRAAGAGWFAFERDAIDFDGVDATGRRHSARVPASPALAVFAPHPLVIDGWQSAAFDPAGPARQAYHSATCSLEPDGGSAPFPAFTTKVMEFVRRETIEVEAGRFDCDHFHIHPHRKDWSPLEMWVTGEDRILCRMDWAVLDSSYRLLSLR